MRRMEMLQEIRKMRFDEVYTRWTEKRLTQGVKLPRYSWRSPRIAIAASFARGPTSSVGPTQEGQPQAQGQARMSCRAEAINASCRSKSRSEKPIPPG